MPELDPFRRLVASAGRVCRLADDPDVFDEYYDSNALRAFREALADLDGLLREVDPVPLPAADLPPPTLADLLGVLLRLPGAQGVEEVAGRLDDELVEQALGHALAMPDSARQADLLVAVAPRLTETQAARALTVVPAMGRAGEQARTLTALLPRLPEARRPAAARVALAAARRLPVALGHTLVQLAPWLDAAARGELYDLVAPAPGQRPGHELCALAGWFRSEQRGAALELIVGVGDENLRAVLLGAIAPHLDEAQLAVALRAAAGITEPGFRARGLAGTARSLPASRRREVVSAALTAAREPGGGRHSYLALSDLVEMIEPDQFDNALAAVLCIPDEHTRAHALGLLAVRLTAAQLPAALAGAEAIADPRARAIASTALVRHVTEELREKAVAIAAHALAARPGAGWSTHLQVLLPHLSDRQLDELWEAALHEERDHPQHGLSTLLPRVHPTRRAAALDTVLGYEPAHLAESLAELAPFLDPALRLRAYRAARRLVDPATQARAIAAVARHLPPGEAAEAGRTALAGASRLRDPAARAALLADLAALLDGEDRRTALAWAVAAARDAEPAEAWPVARTLTRLVPLLREATAESTPRTG
ncbi:hypothetical protein [Micromonospora sp. CA-244673]|uniref:hypothetical protein n=1 Tax=Micromonospora sp. CA-244673 TaxID=3239958 RepID=UPI003D92C0C2